MLSPSQLDYLHRGQPTARSETCIHHEYTATERECQALHRDYMAYVRSGSIAPLRTEQLTESDCHFNSKAARMALRERGPLQLSMLRILKRRWAARCEYHRVVGEPVWVYEQALKLRNANRAARRIRDAAASARVRPTISDVLLRGEWPTPVIVNLTPSEYLALTKVEVSQYQQAAARWNCPWGSCCCVAITVKARPILFHLLMD